MAAAAFSELRIALKFIEQSIMAAMKNETATIYVLIGFIIQRYVTQLNGHSDITNHY